MAKKKYTRVKRKLGTFEVVSGKLRISDPCYDKETWCAGAVSNAAKGTWNAYSSRRKINDNWEQRRHLIATHISYSGEEFVKSKIHAGMDAGMAGIFDDKFYKVDYTADYLQVGRIESDENTRKWSHAHDAKVYGELAEKHKNDELGSVYAQMAKTAKEADKFNYPKRAAEPTRDWYKICCDVSLSNCGAGVIRNGCLSSSGYGDGGADVYVAENDKGQVVGVKLVF